MVRMRNTSGGGAITNINGLKFEELTDLGKRLLQKGYAIEEIKEQGNLVQSGWKVKLASGEDYGLIVKKNGFYRHILVPNDIKWADRVSKKLEPDDCFLSLKSGKFTIIEKKSQSGNGSVDEKLQTADFKLKTYKKLMAGVLVNGEPVKIQFCYLLDGWFNKACYKDVFAYIEEVDCKYFFGEVPLEYLGV